MPDCDRIVITQSIKMTADGTALMPGTYYSPFKCRDVTALSEGTYLDHGKCTYTTPYPVDRGIGTAGKRSATGTAKATYGDARRTSGGDKGFKSAANPGGWSTVTYYFKNYALCALGKDCAPMSVASPVRPGTTGSPGSTRRPPWMTLPTATGLRQRPPACCHRRAARQSCRRSTSTTRLRVMCPVDVPRGGDESMGRRWQR